MNDYDGSAFASDAANEQEIFRELKRVIGDSDPVPHHVVEAAIASRTWRRVDVELAELVYDSLVDAALVRSGGAGRQLTFEARELTLEVEVGPMALDGQLVPPQPAQVIIRHSGGSMTVAADALGHFRVDDPPHGPVSLRCLSETSGSAMVTSWVVI